MHHNHTENNIRRAIIVGFKRGLRNQKMSDVRIIIPNVRHRIEAAKFLGGKILYISEKRTKKDFKTIKGKIVKLHGRSGCFIARFKTNLPPSAITNFVYIKKTNL